MDIHSLPELVILGTKLHGQENGQICRQKFQKLATLLFAYARQSAIEISLINATVLDEELPDYESSLGSYTASTFGIGSKIRQKFLKQKAAAPHFYRFQKLILRNSKSPSRPSTNRSASRGFWMRRTLCAPNAGKRWRSLMRCSTPRFSTCSVTPKQGIGR